MSWEKLTINKSEIDKTIELLKEFKIKYKLTILGEVIGYGLNDDIGIDESKKYKIRKLEYKDKIVLEQRVKSDDCDMDDYILSFKFDKNKVPKKWRIEN